MSRFNFFQDRYQFLSRVLIDINTVYGKTFEGGNFRGFHGFSANRESFPLESFAVYST